jgi:hypothetical protein
VVGDSHFQGGHLHVLIHQCGVGQGSSAWQLLSEPELGGVLVDWGLPKPSWDFLTSLGSCYVWVLYKGRLFNSSSVKRIFLTNKTIKLRSEE